MTSPSDKPAAPTFAELATPDGQARLRRWLDAQAQESADDVEFARSGGVIVTEGPWGSIPAQEVAYLGVDLSGERVALPVVCSHWRVKPDSNGMIVSRRGGVLPRRIKLGPALPGMVVGRAQGQVPVQSYGLVDGEEYYFRSRGDHWSMSIGGPDIHQQPRWYYEEKYGTWPEAGRITEQQAYEFIARAAREFRRGTPTMTERTIDAGTASILEAIKVLTGQAGGKEERDRDQDETS